MHQGVAQEQLAAIKINLGLAKMVAADDEHAPATAELITQVMADTDEAAQPLRALAHGIYPWDLRLACAWAGTDGPLDVCSSV